jgi:hypothetical protein
VNIYTYFVAIFFLLNIIVQVSPLPDAAARKPRGRVTAAAVTLCGFAAGSGIRLFPVRCLIPRRGQKLKAQSYRPKTGLIV